MHKKFPRVLALLALVGLPTTIGSIAMASPPEHAAPILHETPPAKPKQVQKVESKTETKVEAKADAKPDANKAVKGKADKRDATDNRAESAEAASSKVESLGASNSSIAEVAIDADRALKLLAEGNARWVANTPQSPNTDTARRAELADKGQNPFVTVLTCADSRVPVERLFDRGVGDVFVVRVAGNVAGDSETGTIEYGVGHLKTPLLVVMGHTKCGAVGAAVAGGDLHGKVGELVSNITPAVERAKLANPGLTGNDLAAAAVRENVWQTVFQLFKNSPECLDAVRSGQLKVVGAVCDISTGKVEWMGEHPWQSELLAALSPKSASTSHAASNAQGSGGEAHTTGESHDMQTASHSEESEGN